MAFKIVMKYSDGSREEEEDIFDTEAEAEEYAMYIVSCYKFGGEILHQSNPWENPLDEDDNADFEVIEIED